MKSDTVLQCEQCEGENGSLISSELDVTNCRKIENIRGRLVCSSREIVLPKPDDKDTDDIGDTGNSKHNSDEDNNDNVPDPTAVDENPDDGLPAGSYRNDCTGCRLKRDGKLIACDFCQRNSGVQQYTVAFATECKYFINDDGRLRCDRTRSPAT